jgi:hypothetical protein
VVLNDMYSDNLRSKSGSCLLIPPHSTKSEWYHSPNAVSNAKEFVGLSKSYAE